MKTKENILNVLQGNSTLELYCIVGDDRTALKLGNYRADGKKLGLANSEGIWCSHFSIEDLVNEVYNMGRIQIRNK